MRSLMNMRGTALMLILPLVLVLCRPSGAKADILNDGTAAARSGEPTTAQTLIKDHSESGLLGLALAAGNRVNTDLISLVCREDIERFRGTLGTTKTRKLDVISSTVSYDGDLEHHSDIHQNDKPLPQIRGLAGAWSEGEYGTVLGDTLRALKAKPFRFLSNDALDGVDMAVFGFAYTADDSPWTINVAGRSYSLPFRVQVWVSPASGDILRVVRVTEDLPRQTGIANVTWAIDFRMQDVSERSALLPSKAVYSVSYIDAGRHEWNLVSFSQYRRYGADVVIHYQ